MNLDITFYNTINKKNTARLNKLKLKKSLITINLKQRQTFFTRFLINPPEIIKEQKFKHYRQVISFFKTPKKKMLKKTIKYVKKTISFGI